MTFCVLILNKLDKYGFLCFCPPKVVAGGIMFWGVHLSVRAVFIVVIILIVDDLQTRVMYALVGG